VDGSPRGGVKSGVYENEGTSARSIGIVIGWVDGGPLRRCTGIMEKIYTWFLYDTYIKVSRLKRGKQVKLSVTRFVTILLPDAECGPWPRCVGCVSHGQGWGCSFWMRRIGREEAVRGVGEVHDCGSLRSVFAGVWGSKSR
jgi:hypothetical protein